MIRLAPDVELYATRLVISSQRVWLLSSADSKSGPHVVTSVTLRRIVTEHSVQGPRTENTHLLLCIYSRKRLKGN
jgi:hypothetical protein